MTEDCDRCRNHDPRDRRDHGHVARLPRHRLLVNREALWPQYDPPSRARCGAPRHVGCPLCAPSVYAELFARHRAF